MIIVTEESACQDDALVLLHKSVLYIQSLYPEEADHCFKLDQLMSNGSRFFMARHKSVIIGCAAYVWRNSFEVELKHMYVEPFARGIGSGRALLNHVEQYALTDGVKQIVLETSKKQQDAIGLYRSNGYRRCMPYSDHHSEDIFMIKVIDGAKKQCNDPWDTYLS